MKAVGIKSDEKREGKEACKIEQNPRPLPPHSFERVRRPGTGLNATPLDDGGVSIIQSFQDDPLILLEHCRKWVNQALMCDITLSLADKFGLHATCHSVLDHYRLFLKNTYILSLWCDAVLKSVDPRGLHTLLDYYIANLFSPAEAFLEANPQHTREVEHSFKLPANWREDVGGWPERETQPDWGSAWPALIRIKMVADLEYHRKLSRQETPDEADLVTAKQIAKLVFLEPRSIEKYIKELPKPDVPKRGRRPAKWVYGKLREKLIELFKLDPSKVPYKLDRQQPT